jgi:hypothetical protein
MVARWTLASLLALAPAAMFAPAAHAASTPPGVNLRWDHCFADGGVLNKTFACNVNSGGEQLVLSFELDSGMSEVAGMEIVVDVKTTGPALPSWWMFRNIGTCRQNSLGLSFFPPAGSVNCEDWAAGQAAGGLAAYNVGYAGPATAKIVVATAVPSFAIATLSPGIEYAVCVLTVNHAKTVGLGACAGCSEPVCIVFDNLNVVTPSNVGNRRLLYGAKGPDSRFVHWQGASVQNLNVTCPVSRPCDVTFDCTLAVTPVRASRWGEVKALYR